MTQLRILDARSLVALAHPLRIRIRNELRMMGPATATQLAKRFGESSGSTSYHLRMLARHRFVEPDPDHRGGRERWWRAIPEVLNIGAPELKGDPTTRDAVRIIASEVQAQAAEHLGRWVSQRERWSEPWQESAANSLLIARLHPRELAALAKELESVVQKYTERADEPGRRTIEVQLNVFPLGDPE